MEKAEAFDKKHPTGLNLPQLIERGAGDKMVIPANAKVLVDKSH
jgi:hypothetical protein